MRTKPLVISLVVLIVVFMVGTLVIALTQEDIGWGWWWVVPVSGVFLLAIIGFRVAVQRSVEAAERADRQTEV